MEINFQMVKKITFKKSLFIRDYNSIPIYVFMLSFLINQSIAADYYIDNSGKEIAPFVSDGCSVFPDGLYHRKDTWLSCCTEHDKAYWKGGTYSQRLQADETLQECVSEIGFPRIADLMLRGVRLGGSPYFPTVFRWGYGWKFPRGYKALTKRELDSVREKEE